LYQGSVSVLLGNGDGTFQPAVTYPTGKYTVSVAVGDFNGDGIPDLVTANEGSFPTYVGTASVLLGNGDGTFQPAGNYPVGSKPLAVAVGAFQNDGILDVVTANSLPGTVSLLRGNGNGTFKPAVSYAAGSGPDALAVGKLTGNGLPDLVVAD